MRLSQVGQLALLAGGASAFPSKMMEAVNSDPELKARADELLATRQEGADGATAVFEAVPVFDAEAQLVDVSEGSGHEWQAPRDSDLRGPCPGLNAFANHGFLPRNGYATISEFIDATMNVVGMGPGLAAFLAAFGAVIDGSGTAWSIGGTPPASIAPVGLGGNGISGSHNKYESDVSPTRPDLYQYGNNYKTRPEQFQQLIDFSPGGTVDLNTLTAFRSQRFDDQIAQNPYFFNGPFSGVLVQPAAYTFIFRFMANHSEENPTGLLSYDVLESWFAMTGGPGNYEANQGMERIPDNWYKRSLTAPYDQAYFLSDATNAALLHPKFLDVGGNTGKVDTFSGVDVEDLTGGLMNSKSLFKNNNFACFAYQFAAQAKPDLALNLLGKLTGALNKVTSALSCPQLKKMDEDLLMQFPGYKRSPAAK